MYTGISRRGNPLRSIFRSQPSSSHAHSTRSSLNHNILQRFKQQRHGFSTFGVAVLWIAALWGYAATHQEEAPDIGRKRLIIYDEKAIANIEQAQNPLLAVTQAVIRVGERMPGILLPQDDSRYIAVRKVLDRLLLAYKLDPSEWRLCIDCQGKNYGNTGVSFAFHNKIVVVSTDLLETLLYEEALAACISYDLAKITSGNESEILSWVWQGKACSYPAILLALTSCFRTRLWFLTIPYLFWWASYSGVDEALGYGGKSLTALEELGAPEGATDQEQVEVVMRATLGMRELLEFENSYRSMLYIARAGIHPRWAQYARQACLTRQLESLSHVLKSAAIESRFLENTDKAVDFVDSMHGTIEDGTRARDAVILMPRVEKEVPGLQSWDVTSGTPLPKAAQASDSHTNNANAEEWSGPPFP